MFRDSYYRKEYRIDLYFSLFQTTISHHTVTLFLISWLLHQSCPVLCGLNATATTTPEIPLVIPQPRLPVLYQSIESNATDAYYDASAKAKKIVDVKEVHETPDENGPRDANRTSHTQYESSPSSISSENYITIGEQTRKSNFSKHVESGGFTPFVPSPLFVPHLESKPHFKDFDDDRFKSSVPAKQEQFYKPYFNNYPTYGEVQSVHFDEPSYSKYQERDRLPYITTFAPPKITPMHRPSLSFYKKKRPYTGAHYDTWKTSEHLQAYGKYQSDFNQADGFQDQGYGGFDDGYNVFHKHALM